jgi:hypothetical protein
MVRYYPLSTKQKLSVIRSINYRTFDNVFDKNNNNKLYYVHNLPEDVLRYIFKFSGKLEMLITLSLFIKNKRYLCLYVDPRKDIKYLYEKVIDTLTSQLKKSFIGIRSTKMSINYYKKVINYKTKGKIKDIISKDDIVEFLGPISKARKQIFIKYNKIYVIWIDINANVDCLMESIYRKIKIPKNLQILNYAGKNLHFYPFISLANLDIQKESTIHLSVRG